MVGNYYTLRALASSLDGLLRGKVLGSIFSQEREELVIGFEAFDPSLIVSCRAGETTCFLHPGFARARRNSVDLLPDARRRIIRRVWLPEADRTLMLECRDGARLALKLYTPRANVLLLDEAGRIIDAFQRAKDLQGQAHGLRERAPRISPLNEHLGAGVPEAIRRWKPELGQTLTQELLHRAGTKATSLEQEAQSLLEELSRPGALVYRDGAGSAMLFSIVPLHHLPEWERREFGDIHEAIRSTVYGRRSMRRFLAERSELLSRIRQAGERAARSLAALRADHTGRAEEYARSGELILAHLHEIPPGADQVELPPGADQVELPPGAPTQRIRLDPSASASRNAQRYFEKARATRRAAKGSLDRSASLERRAALALELHQSLEACRDRHQLEETMTRRRDDLTGLGIDAGNAPQEELPFRVFTVEGGFQVWAGKNSTNNDLLTLRYARPNDLWFHARGSGGSHVVLRTGSAAGEPGKRAREQAASIAAYYSRMRNASVVPVTITEKKHVRKPRGAPPGTVTVERESVIFAAPGLPQEPRSRQ